jgi:TonB family protein
MTGILRNLARMRSRSEARRRQRESEAVVGSAPSYESAAPDHLLEKIELQRVLAELLANLREPLRSTVLLRYYEGKSSVDIARELGTPEGTVRRHLKEGLDQLRSDLAQRYGSSRWALVVAPLATRPGRVARDAGVSSSGISAATKLAGASAAIVVAAGSAVLLARWSGREERKPTLAAAIEAPSAGSGPTRPNQIMLPPATDPQRKETEVKMNQLRRAVQTIALAAGTTAASAGADPPAPPPAAKVQGALDRAEIGRVVARHANEVKWCYETELAKNPHLAGRVDVRFTIEATGTVSDSAVESSTLGNATVETCIARAVRRWEFPKPADGKQVIVTYPFQLTAAR